MSLFNQETARKISRIPVRECRGSRLEFSLFIDEKSFLSALRQAEKAYLKEESLFRNIPKLVQMQEKFAGHFRAMFRAWNDLPSAAKNDLAERADYFSAIEKFGDDEEVLAKKRSDLSERAIARLVTGFDRTFFLMERAARDNRMEANFSPGPIRSVKRDGVNKGPLCHFAYSFKLFWDKTMEAGFGRDFNKRVPFSVATPMLTAASRVLSDRYVAADIKSIVREVQKSGYKPEGFDTSRQVNLLVILRPQLAKAAGMLP